LVASLQDLSKSRPAIKAGKPGLIAGFYVPALSTFDLWAEEKLGVPEM